MRVLVCGGRDYDDRLSLFAAMDKEHRERNFTLVIHGACVNPKTKQLCGADGLAEQWALRNEINYCGVPAKWTLHGRSAGPRRNQDMLDKARPDLVISASGGRGTADMVKRAKAANIHVTEVP